MAHIRAVDDFDFQAIRAPMEGFGRERDGAAVTDADRRSVEPAQRSNNTILVSFSRLLDIAGHSLVVPDASQEKLGSLDLYLSGELGGDLRSLIARALVQACLDRWHSRRECVGTATRNHQASSPDR